MTHLFLTAGTTAAVWPEIFSGALTLFTYCCLFVALGLSFVTASAGVLLRCKTTEDAAALEQFWRRLTVATVGIALSAVVIQDLLTALLWHDFHYFAGSIFGAPLSVGTIVAIVAAACLTWTAYRRADGMTASGRLMTVRLLIIALLLLVWMRSAFAAWREFPTGYHFNPDTIQHEMTSWSAVALSPFVLEKFLHNVGAALTIGSLVALALTFTKKAKQNGIMNAGSYKARLCSIGLSGVVIASVCGGFLLDTIAEKQPMKMAAMKLECLPLEITGSDNGRTPTTESVMRGGYWMADGKIAVSVNTKIKSGREAIIALRTYRDEMKKEAADTSNVYRNNRKEMLARTVEANIDRFGYGSLSDKEQLNVSVTTCKAAIRTMFLATVILLVLFAASLVSIRNKRLLSAGRLERLALLMLVLALTAIIGGFCLTLAGNAPWLIDEQMPIWVGLSNMPTSLIIGIYGVATAVLCYIIYISIKLIKPVICHDTARNT